MFFVDGLTQGPVVQLVMSFLLAIPPEAMVRAGDARNFIKYNMPYLDTLTEPDVDKALKHMYSGLLPVLIDGYDEIIIIDIREYPSRSVEEPSKEKSLRGAKEMCIRDRILSVPDAYSGAVISKLNLRKGCLLYTSKMQPGSRCIRAPDNIPECILRVIPHKIDLISTKIGNHSICNLIHVPFFISDAASIYMMRLQRRTEIDLSLIHI